MSRALDVGCGTGAEAIFLASMGWSVVGIDSDEDNDVLGAAKNRASAMLSASARKRITFLKKDVLEFRDSKPYHLIVERLVFQNIESQRQRSRFIVQCARLLERGTGVLMLRTRPDELPVRSHWGEINRRYSKFTDHDEEVLLRYFAPGLGKYSGKEVALTSLLSRPAPDHDAMIVGTVHLAIRILVRNQRFVPKLVRRSRRPQR